MGVAWLRWVQRRQVGLLPLVSRPWPTSSSSLVPYQHVDSVYIGVGGLRGSPLLSSWINVSSGARHLASSIPRATAAAGSVPKRPPSIHLRSLLLYSLLAAPPLAAIAWSLSSPDPLHRLAVVYSLPVRVGRGAGTALAMTTDYVRSLYGVPEGAERDAVLRECHERGAKRLLRLCFDNAGTFIKLGQHIALLDYLLPDEYVVTMREHMLNRCPRATYEQVCQVFRQELGCLPTELFAEFDPEPIASASLAQVHVARAHDGTKLAVKVQHEWLDHTYQVDLLTVTAVVGAVRWLFPDFDYWWLVEEMRESLPRELDFRLEAGNARQCEENFCSSRLRDDVAIPAVHAAMSTKRVLVMDFAEGVSVYDADAIAQMGLKAADVAALVSSAFAEMTFRHGFVHCDPHGANLLVRPMPHSSGKRNQPQLVLLDHGLYRTLSPDFKFHYASLWKALVLSDVDGIKRESRAVGAGDAYPLFAAMLTARPWDKIAEASLDHLAHKGTPEEKAEVQAYAQHFALDATKLLKELPRVMLLLLKTNDCLRAIDRALGTPVNTFVIVARECTRALADARLQQRPGFTSRIGVVIDSLRVEWRVLLLRTFAWLAAVRNSWPALLTWL
eukprot:jgi/Chlat1/6928/Chrsp52S06595